MVVVEWIVAILALGLIVTYVVCKSIDDTEQENKEDNEINGTNKK